MRLFVVLLVSAILSVKSYASETKWHDHDGMLQTRVVATSMSDDAGKKLLAWEAKLAPGWKTYWRSPGEAGLPVKISSSGEQIEVLYPFPERFELFGLETYGYGKQVIMPFYVDAQSAEVPVKVDFMVCKDICVPFNIDYMVDTSGADDSIHDIRVSSWMDKVPARVGDDGAGLEVLSAKLVGKMGHQKVVVDATGSGNLTNADMLAEIGTVAHFGKPKKRMLPDGKTVRFVLSAQTGNKKIDLKGKQVRLSFTNGRGASIERFIDL
ncbi:hypothetical protein KFE96_15340 [Kordiimonas sp. SCSIO 12603]|uniref:protein-disulfide reductase DsbD domain-containing protein n=1 Tax=Kordiimonas sp. SCSIO 12603 TaxID=2829596 RepID=UPI0021038FEB|nr:protein-disulfide reductase DsbD domain-containing protein [Kordiimonas sp. SCSIO 12603]UTW58180.1 hypothetical protein KFE96_15340 [Kordiimonas sp. SCSIO 12603]